MMPATETLYEAFISETDDWLGIGTIAELHALSDDGILPPREQVTLRRVGVFAKGG